MFCASYFDHCRYSCNIGQVIAVYRHGCLSQIANDMQRALGLSVTALPAPDATLPFDGHHAGKLMLPEAAILWKNIEAL